MIDYTSDETESSKFMTIEELFSGLEDCPSEPVDQLLTMKFQKIDEERTITQKDIDKDVVERANNGLATRDIWDFCSYWTRLLAVMTREKNITASPVEKYSNNLIINGCVALVETFNMNDMAFLTNAEERHIENARWHKQWDDEVHRLKNVFILEWFSNPTKSEPTWDHETIDTIFNSLTSPFHYDDVKELIIDPIQVPLSDLATHYAQRGIKGYSTWDLKETRTYTMWVFIKACVFFASEDSAGWPANDVFTTKDVYDEHMLTVAKNIMHGEVATAGNFFEDESNAQYQKNYREVIAKFTEMIPSMWD